MQPSDDNPFLNRGGGRAAAVQEGVGVGVGAWPPSPSPGLGVSDTQQPTRGAALHAEARQEEASPPPKPPPRMGGITERELYVRSLTLDAREARVAAREAQVQAGLRTLRPHNWPSIFPITYHNIAEEIQVGQQRMVYKAYHAWAFAATGYVFNLLVLTISFLGGGASTTVSNWFIALLVAGVGIPASWQGWYRSLYAAAQTEAGLLAYSRFFFHFSFHLLWCLWMLLALPRVGRFTAGLFRVLEYFSATNRAHMRLNRALGVLSLVNMGLWTCTFILSLHTLTLAVSRFRAAGGTAELRRQTRSRAAGAVAEAI